MMARAIPGQPVPPLAFDLIDGSRFDIADNKPDYLTMIEVYRGRHCPRCHRHLLELAGLLPRFEARGVQVVAVSSDGEDRAREAHAAWGLGALRIGYDLTEEMGRAWGLFVSNPITPSELKPFFEPATFFVRPGGVLFAASLSSTPFARSRLPDWLEGLETAKARDYPPRGDRP